jgi:hypothetical protein
MDVAHHCGTYGTTQPVANARPTVRETTLINHKRAVNSFVKLSDPDMAKERDTHRRQGNICEAGVVTDLMRPSAGITRDTPCRT